MDVGGSFLELACVRVALIPAGSTIPDARFEELTSYITSFREIPVSALPRRTPLPRGTVNATFSMPPGLRETLADPKRSLPRSRSTTRDIGRSGLNSRNLLTRRPSSHGAALTSTKSGHGPSLEKSSSETVAKSLLSAKTLSPDDSQLSSELSLKPSARLIRLRANLSTIRKSRSTNPVYPRNGAELDLTAPDVGSTFRLRYDVIHRDHAGDLIMKPFSEWDAFHSSKMWGVIGIVDCTQPGICDNEEEMKTAIKDAYADFQSILNNFKDAVVKRLIIFTSEEAASNASTVVQDETSLWLARPHVSEFSTGYVPEQQSYEDTKREVRAQFVHFAGLVLNAIDKNCAKMKDVPGTELFVSPIDGKHSIDRQSQLIKRRAGRLDKLLGDCFLLMGSPEEALARYNSAIERAKANSDRLWIAGAMEGWAAAHTLTYISSGGNVKDIILTDRLIEQYAEVFKLYQKKRVVEPEAAAALRLAEFLGTWGNRRKESLDAAEHAATVGEGLKPTKRAALWEALARYSDRMGYRRKAALYLYRLGQLNASQSIWSSAVALLTACEKQLSIGQRKPWSAMNREVLLIAAVHAQNAGDSTEAARLYSEALVIQPLRANTNQSADSELLKSLRKSQVPAFLPAASRVVKLVEIHPLQIPGLSVRNKEFLRKFTKATEPNDGPFIYNPFEAKKRATAASALRQPITWVCGEPAQISMGLINQTGTELVVEVVAVLIFDDCTKNDPLGDFEDFGSKIARENHAGVAEQLASTKHRNHVRRALESSTKIVKTITETVNLDHEDRRFEHKKHLTVVPRRTGAFRVRGLLIRLFGGALVVLRVQEEEPGKLPVINVISALPRISLSSQCVEGETLETVSNRTPMTIFDGERRDFRVIAQNTGTSEISQIHARISSSRSNLVQVSASDFSEKKLLSGLEYHGGTKSFDVQVTGNFERREQNEAYIWRHRQLATLTISFEYEGKDSAGTLRESKIQMRVSSQPAIRIGRATIFEHYSAKSRKRPDEQSRVYCIAVDVTNEVSVPAQVLLSQKPYEAAQQHRYFDESFRKEGLTSSECLVEAGASARVVGTLNNETLEALRALLTNQTSSSSGQSPGKGRTALNIFWSLPALGRHGKMDVSVEELWKATLQGGCVPSRSPVQQFSSSTSNSSTVPIEIRLSIIDNQIDKRLITSSAENNLTSNLVEVGRFWTVMIDIWRSSGAPLPETAELDIDLFQRDGQGLPHRLHNAVIVGAVQNIAVGPRESPTISFKHTVKVRMSSSGTFHLQACLYENSSTSRDNGTVNNYDNQELDQYSRALTNNNSRDHQLQRTRTEKVNPATDVSEKTTEKEQVSKIAMKLPATPKGSVKASFLRWGGQTESGSSSQHVITPMTVDSFPHTVPLKQHSLTYACSVLTFVAKSPRHS